MSIDKKIDYVEQDGSLNFIKDSESVTVPKKFKARKNAPAVKLAYITDAEAKMLKKKKVTWDVIELKFRSIAASKALKSNNKKNGEYKTVIGFVFAMVILGFKIWVSSN